MYVSLIKSWSKHVLIIFWMLSKCNYCATNSWQRVWSCQKWMPYPCIMADQFFALVTRVGKEAVVAWDAVGTVVWLDVLAAVQGLLAVVTVKTVGHRDFLWTWNRQEELRSTTMQKKKGKIQKEVEKDMKSSEVLFCNLFWHSSVEFDCQYLCCKYFSLLQRWSWAQTKHAVQVAASGKRARHRRRVRETVKFYCCVMKVRWIQREGGRGQKRELSLS